MTFKEIIMAAMEEISVETKSPLERFRAFIFNARRIFIYNDYAAIQCITISLWDRHLFEIHPKDLMDPSWSPATLAKQINDEIAGAKNDL